MARLEYSYIWEYRVKEGCAEEFERHYGPEGTWVQLFRRASGYLGTSLYKDVDAPDRYVTIDRWESAAAFHAFRKQFAAEFKELDDRCESFTVSETPLGSFDSVN